MRGVRLSQATESRPDTIETQKLIYKRRIQRLSVTKGVDRGTLIDRVNAISEDKRRSIDRQTEPCGGRRKE
jgi:hypothetical protein